ncbi:MAG TPA: methyltransferase, partial [Polyangiaceae bacterium]|nr:methyltransferase [Polyangiaceae bacterium]
MPGSQRERLRRVLDLALPLRDILEQRVEEPIAPAWCETRGWTGFLTGLDDSALGRCEAEGLAGELLHLPGAPADLRALAHEVETAVELPRLRGAQALEQESLRNVKLRKRAQLAGLLAGVSHMAEHAERIVDVGAGVGHFTRLSSELFQRPALGLERDPARVATAQRRAGGVAGAGFVTVDARQPLELGARDLAIGLHACGELGDRLVESAAGAACDLALVSCCLQKISPPSRYGLSKLSGHWQLPRAQLGLTNLTAQPQGVETSIEVTIAARQTRYALRRLLRDRGVELAAGVEMHGINRRRAHRGLGEVARRALELRGLSPATASELALHEAAAAREYAVMRRLSLPRSMLARLVEVFVCLDRA